MTAQSERKIGPEAPHGARWDCAALNIVNQIWQIPPEWPEMRRKAHAQILIIEALKAADTIPRRAKARPDTRTCTCHPDDAPIPCPRKFATHHCWRAAVHEETRAAVVELKNRDTSPIEQKLLGYLKRVERALDGAY